MIFQIVQGLAFFYPTVRSETTSWFFWRRFDCGAARLVYSHFLMPLRSENCDFTSVRVGWHNGGTAQRAAASNPP
jgi:hypothetical protein